MPINWPMDRFDAANTGHPPTTGPDHPPAELWRCDVEYAVQGVPAVVGGRVYVATMYPTHLGTPNLFGVNRDTGEIRMRTRPDDPSCEIRGSPCVADGVVYVTLLDDPPITRGYDAVNGERVREFDVTPPINRDKSPLVADGVLYATTDFALGAYDVETGREQWVHTPTARIHGNPALVDGTLYLAVSDRSEEERHVDDDTFTRRLFPRVQAIDATSGNLEWERKVSAVPETLAVGDGTCYCAGRESYERYTKFELPEEMAEVLRQHRSDGGTSEYGLVQALSTDDGEEQWRTDVPSRITTSPGVTGTRVVLGTDAGTVVGLDAATGEQVWRFETASQERIRTAPAIADGVAYVGGGEWLYGIEADTGEVAWRHDLGSAMTSAPAVVDGTIYLVTKDHSLRALG